MFCTNCGANVPDSAKFCSNCGATIGAPSNSTASNSIGGIRDASHLVAAKCTNCGGALEVDPTQEAAVCKYCNTPFIIEKAINNYNVSVSGGLNVGSATINIGNINIENYITRANDFLEKGRYDDAEVYFQKVLDDDFSNKAAREGLEKVYSLLANDDMKKANWIPAAEYAKKAVEVVPESQNAKNLFFKIITNIAYELGRELDFESAVLAYQKMLNMGYSQRGNEISSKIKLLQDQIQNYVYIDAQAGMLIKDRFQLTTKFLKIIPFKGEIQYYEYPKMYKISGEGDTVGFKYGSDGMFTRVTSFKIGDQAYQAGQYLEALKSGKVPVRKQYTERTKILKEYVEGLSWQCNRNADELTLAAGLADRDSKPVVDYDEVIFETYEGVPFAKTGTLKLTRKQLIYTSKKNEVETWEVRHMSQIKGTFAGIAFKYPGLLLGKAYSCGNATELAKIINELKNS